MEKAGSGISIVAGLIIKNAQGLCFRIISTNLRITLLCLLDTSKLILKQIETDLLMNGLLEGTYTIISSHSTDVNCVTSELSETIQKKYIAYMKIINDVEQYCKKDYFRITEKEFSDVSKTIIQKNNVSKSTFWRILRFFFQSGLNYGALIDGRYFRNTFKDGYLIQSKDNKGLENGLRLTQEVKGHFIEAIEGMKKSHTKTFKKAFLQMSLKYYSENTIIDGTVSKQLLPQYQRPTIKSFYRFSEFYLNQEAKDIMRTNPLMVRNNHRLLSGSSDTDAAGPGDLVEMDEEEGDCIIRSEITGETIGRPIVFLMIDIYSRFVLAAYVGLHNNSFLGATSCFLNLCENKVEYFAGFGIHITPEMYPVSANCLPARIRADHGSEYISYNLQRSCAELGIDLQNVAPGTGSLKGTVERWFGEVNTDIINSLEGKGAIRKANDSTHYKDKKITLKEYAQMIFTFINKFNQKEMPSYALKPDQLAQGIKPIPIALWNFGCEYHGAPRPITTSLEKQFRYSLLEKVTANIYRRGIEYHKLYYFNKEDTARLNQMYENGDKREKIEIRIDPRDVSHVFLPAGKNDFIVYSLSDNSANLAYMDRHISTQEMIEVQEQIRSNVSDMKEYNENLDASALETYDAIASNAQRTPGNDSKGIRQNRQAELAINDHVEAQKNRFKITGIKETDNHEMEKIPNSAGLLGESLDNVSDAADEFLEDN